MRHADHQSENLHEEPKLGGMCQEESSQLSSVQRVIE